MATFGYTTQGSSTLSAEDAIPGTWFATPADMTSVEKISVYLALTTAAKNGCAMVYAYTSTTDAGAFVGKSDEVNVGTGTAWVDFPFTTPLALSPSTNYYLVCWLTAAGGVGNMHYNDSTSNDGLKDNQTYAYATPPDPLVENNTYSGRSFSIYATYTPTPGGTSIKTVDGLAEASVKTKLGLANASVKTFNGLA